MQPFFPNEQAGLGSAGDRSRAVAILRASLARAGLETPEKQLRIPLGAAAADDCLQGGIPRAALHEIFAEGGHEATATGFAAALAFRLAANRPVLWIRPDFCAGEFGEVTATGLLELGLDPARLLLLRVGDAAAALRAAADALSCAALGAVVIEIAGAPKILDLAASRKLSLASAQKGVTAFLLRFAAEPQASAAATRWRLRAARSPEPGQEEGEGCPAFETALLRNRHGRVGHWVMEWDCEDGLFRERCDKSAAASGDMAAAPSH